MPDEKSFTFDAKKFQEHLNNIKNEQAKFAGKHNHNPFIWINKNVLPLEERFNKGERTKELFDAALAIKAQPPVVNPAAKTAESTKISVEPTHKAPEPQGLKLK
jgi:hypothetical protein